MSSSLVVIDASPLIILSRSGHLDLLRVVAKKLWVPEAVENEIRRQGRADVTTRALTSTNWLSICRAQSAPPKIARWGLRAGESSVLSLTAAHQAEAVIDDAKGRKCASSL